MGSGPFYEIGISIYKRELKNRDGKLRAILWKKLPLRTHYKVFIGHFNKQPRSILKLGRNKLRVVAGFLTGYTHHDG